MLMRRQGSWAQPEERSTTVIARDGVATVMSWKLASTTGWQRRESQIGLCEANVDLGRRCRSVINDDDGWDTGCCYEF
ncbi:hypothetical protein M0R45_018133 [Rubus argutus]|uniref:Uncharacterized protein n=1 Tax=Rubus argutus TaxID=59490 RepID=A0AAW1X5C5_RUBAR